MTVEMKATLVLFVIFFLLFVVLIGEINNGLDELHSQIQANEERLEELEKLEEGGGIDFSEYIGEIDRILDRMIEEGI